MTRSTLDHLRSAVLEAYNRRFVPPDWTFHDVFQQTQLGLIDALGKDYLDQLSEYLAHGGSLRDHTEVRREIRRAIDKARGTYNKRRQRGLPQIIYVAENPEIPGADHVTEFTVDVMTELGRLDDRDREVVQLRRQQYTIREISENMGISVSRVNRTLRRVRERLAKILDLDMTKK